MTEHAPRNYVTFTSNNGLKIQVLMDGTASNVTDGYGQWEVVSRPKRTAIVRYSGRDPFKMDVPVVFDGLISATPQEHNISQLMRMSQPPADLTQPPTLTVEGAVPLRGFTWVIDSFDWDNGSVIWDMFGGAPARLHQPVVVHLLEYVDDVLITTQSTPAAQAGGGGGGSQVKVGSGKTARQEALAAYGDPTFASLLFDANPFLVRDPRAVIPAGTTIFFPPGTKGISGNVGK